LFCFFLSFSFFVVVVVMAFDLNKGWSPIRSSQRAGDLFLL
jgi:hypothetical protein